MPKLILCKECSVGCWGEEHAKKHIEETGHEMDMGVELTPIDHTNPSEEDKVIQNIMDEMGEVDD